MDTITESGILTLQQWFSPAYPVGAFHFSHGLEGAVDGGEVSDGGTLRDWIRDVLMHGAGAADAVFLSAAYRAGSGEGLQEIDEVARAMAPSAERLRETVDMGRTFGTVTGKLLGRELPDLVYPVVVGLSARLAGLPLQLTASTFLQAFAANLTLAGIRMIPVGQSEGQEIIRDLLPTCNRIAQEAEPGDLDCIGTSVFAADIASMRHETQYSRIFRT